MDDKDSKSGSQASAAGSRPEELAGTDTKKQAPKDAVRRKSNLGRPGGEGVSLFDSQLGKAVVSKTLPLLHATDWACFMAIAEQGELSAPQPCNVYGEPLIYAFYGRHAYRLGSDQKYHHLPTFAPVCFILKPELLTVARRIMPFDSGGFSRYGPAMHPSMKKEMFELPPALQSPMRVVRKFFGSNLQYFNRMSKPSAKIDPVATALLHYYNLISHKLSIEIDDRSSCVEVQLASPVSLEKHVLALVVPCAVADAFAAGIASKLGADLLVYTFEPGPYYVKEYFPSVRNSVRGYLVDKGLI